jgi:hypothetical protein
MLLRIFFRFFIYFDIASHLRRLKKNTKLRFNKKKICGYCTTYRRFRVILCYLSCKSYANSTRLLWVNDILNNTSKNYGSGFAYFAEKKFLSLGTIHQNSHVFSFKMQFYLLAYCRLSTVEII